MLAIRYYRLQRGLSQTALAHIVGTTQATISLIEVGLLSPDDRLLAGLAGALRVAPAFVLLKPISAEGDLESAGSGVSE